MDQLTKAITIAGFFHDLGKFAERAYAVIPGDKDEVKQHYRYAHAYHTELALKQLFNEDRISKQIGREKECTVLNLAARHHKPRNIFEIIVSEADRIASGHERVKADEQPAAYDTGGRERKSKIPLLSILSRIQLHRCKDDPLDEDWRYRLTTPAKVILQEEVETIFPVTVAEYPSDEVQRDYKAHWQAFKMAIRPDKEKGLDPFDNFRTIFEISRLYQWCLPATTRKEDMPDVSLFDHNKVTGAIAACLYEYHKSKGARDQAEETQIRDRKEGKYILFCGDISGIQNFIYQISSKGAYKHLKGRSFYIQILAEVLANHLVKACGLTFMNILYASGGKFYLLLPNTKEIIQNLRKQHEKINQELFRLFNGDIYLRTGWKSLSGDDLTRESGKTLYEIWEQLTRETIFADRQRYSFLIKNDFDAIFGQTDYLPASCSVCHRSFKGDSDGICKTCREMEELGRKLGNARYIAIGNSDSDMPERYVFKFLGHYVWILDAVSSISGPSDLIIYHLEDAEIQTIPLENESKNVNSAIFFTGSTHKFDETFDEIAKKSHGIERLGILRMDVDDLGKIFNEGLLNYKHDNITKNSRFYSLGRITTLSWQLSLFFSGIVPALIRLNDNWRDRATVVYSGGDDLFLLGAWDAIPEIALQIRRKFKEFCCNNRSFSLSGGIVVTGGKFPIYKSAEMAGDAEKAAKKNVTLLNKEVVKKDSITFLDLPMHWQEFEIIAKEHDNLLEILEEKSNYSLLQRLRQIYGLCRTCQEKFQDAFNMKMKALEEKILSERWQWIMVYSLSRFSKDRPDLKERIEELQHFIASKVAGTERLGIELLGVLSRWTEFRLREK